MNSGLNKTRLPLLPLQALQHPSQWETSPGQTSLSSGGAEMCCRVTRSDVIPVYFQHIHVNVDTGTPRTSADTTPFSCTCCSVHTRYSLHVSVSPMDTKRTDCLARKNFWGLFLHAGLCPLCLLPCLVS